MSKNIMPTSRALSLSAEDFSALNPAEQRAVARQLIDVAHKRYVRGVEEWGEFDALREYAKSTEKRAKVGKTIKPMEKGRQSITGKKGKQLYKEFEIAQKFLTSKTSTQKGRQQAKKKFENSIGRQMTMSEFRAMWDAYEDLRKADQKGLITVKKQIGSDDFFAQFFDRVTQLEDTVITKKQLKGILRDIKKEYRTRSKDEEDAFSKYQMLMNKKRKKETLTNDEIELLRRYEEEYNFSYTDIIS